MPTVRPAATRKDLRDLERLFLADLAHEPRMPAIRAMMRHGHVLLAYNDSRLVGFIYGAPIAPDIMELQRIYLTSTARNHGLGHHLLTAWETAVRKNGMRQIIAINSDAYAPDRDSPTRRRPDAFYLAAGYTVLTETLNTRVWHKIL